MTDNTPKVNRKINLSDKDMEYALKELELHVNWQIAATDRAEQIIQTYLTVITAIIGGIILIIQASDNYLIIGSTFFAGSLSIFAFGVFFFVRLIGHRKGVTQSRIKVFLIRRTFQDNGIRPASLITPESPSTGFSSRTVTMLTCYLFFVACFSRSP